MSVEFSGLEDLMKRLKDNANLDDVKQVVKVNGAEMQKRAKRNAPVLTGTLKRSINLRIIEGGYTARIATNTHYAGYQEYGTRWIYPKRYMWRAWVVTRKQYQADMRKLISGRVR